MSNSIIINFIENSANILKRSYKNSLLCSVFSKTSNAISLIVRESLFLSILAGKQNFNTQWDRSIINFGTRLVSVPFRSLSQKCDNIRDSVVKTSIICTLAEDIYSRLVVLDSRFLGSIIAGFLVTALGWSARWGFGDIKFKIISVTLFFVSLFLFLLNRSLLDIYKNSLFKKTIERILKLN